VTSRTSASWLDAVHSGLLVVASQDSAARIDEAIIRGEKVLSKQVSGDTKDLEAALDATAKAATD
jgi:hypothetical protein